MTKIIQLENDVYHVITDKPFKEVLQIADKISENKEEFEVLEVRKCVTIDSNSLIIKFLAAEHEILFYKSMLENYFK